MVTLSVHLKELLEKIKYECYSWVVCGDFKIVGFLLGLQDGYTKYSFSHCFWDSRASDQLFFKRAWLASIQLITGRHIVIHEAHVLTGKILLLSFSIIVRRFIKALGHTSDVLTIYV